LNTAPQYGDRTNHDTMINKFESLQKKCIKWILSEEPEHYHSHEKYLFKCRQARILPLAKRFDLNDLILFYKIVYELIPLKLPDYLRFFEGQSRLRSCHLDSLSIVSSINPRINSLLSVGQNSPLNKSFFYRTHFLWNKLPYELRASRAATIFRCNLVKYFWDNLLTDNEGSPEELNSNDTTI
jgi:hypothetical protein